MKIGVRAHDLGSLSPKALNDALISYGFDGIQLVSNKVFNQKILDVNINEINEYFNNKVFLLGAYFNMVHPNKEIVSEGINNFLDHIKIAKKINAKYIGTETGSLMGSPWGYVPENHLDTSFNEVLDITKRLVKEASRNDCFVAIEGAYAHVIYSPKRLKQLVDEVDSDYLKVIIDVYNFLNISNHATHVEIFLESIKLLKDKIVIFHLKDYILEDNKLKQVGLGKGLMNYNKILPIIKKELPMSYLIFEGVEEKDMSSSISFIKNILSEGD